MFRFEDLGPDRFHYRTTSQTADSERYYLPQRRVYCEPLEDEYHAWNYGGEPYIPKRLVVAVVAVVAVDEQGLLG
jgi:hypothetical protein